MGTLGRNFDFRQNPIPQHRLGRFKTGATAIPNGVPVVADGDPDPADLRRKVKLAVTADTPDVGSAGILVYEAPYDGYSGSDPVLTRASDIDTAPAGRPAQVCHGTETRVLLQNTVERSFEGQRDYPARLMLVDDLDTLAVDDTLVPAAAGSDELGYWLKGSTAPWLRITYIDTAAGFVEAQMLF